MAVISVDLEAASTPNISQLKNRCENITPQQRRLAEAAGYNLDQICDSLNAIDSDTGASSKRQSTSSQDQFLNREDRLFFDERGILRIDLDAKAERESTQDLLLSEEELKFLEEQSLLEEEISEDEELEPFGYDIFSGVPTTFAPNSDIAIPKDYELGPQDTFNIQLIGGDNASYQVAIDRNGKINLPDIGEITVAGLTFDDFRELLQQKVAENMIGVRVIVNLQELRSMRVFVLGDAFKPGSYLVSSLSTMTNAILVSGGVSDIGSLRNIQLKRNGIVITNLDLYDLLLRGDISDDARLQSGDVIYIPPVGETVAITGAVKRPAIYELANEQSLESIVELAGGPASRAYKRIVAVERPSDSGYLTHLEFSLEDPSVDYIPQAGDRIEVLSVLEDAENIVTLSGHFHRPRNVPWRKGLKLNDIVSSVMDFKDDIDLRSGLIIREILPLKQLEIHFFDLSEVLSGSEVIELSPMDEIITFDNRTDRTELLEELLEKIDNQRTLGELSKVVTITGNVKYPGDYPYAESMSVQDLIALSGGLREATYLGRAEISRRSVTGVETASSEHFNINIQELSRDSEFTLAPRDKLSIYQTPDYKESRSITIQGEVRFPGIYEFSRGETLSGVIRRAGGFSELAHVEASVFTREELRIAEAKLLEDLQEDLEKEVAAAELGEQSAGAKVSGAEISNAEKLLESLDESEALGRLVIQLEGIMNGENDDILLKDGDLLVVPPFRQEVSVVGEVQRVTSHIYNTEWLLDDYIEGSGGFTDRADTDRMYVVRADGSIFLPNKGGWLSHHEEMISAGDTIVVPLEADRIKRLTLWTSVSQIIYQLALGAAAVTRL